MNDEGRLHSAPASSNIAAADDSKAGGARRAGRMTAPWWTAADDAELDVLVLELARGHAHHREHCAACRPGRCSEYAFWLEHLEACPACRGRAPLTYGPPCPRRRAMVEHGNACPRCNPCPHVIAAIAVVGDWLEARELTSRAAFLRAERDALEAA